LLGYWFFTTGGQFSGTTSEVTCRGEFLQYCISWSAVNFEKGQEHGRKDFFTANNDCAPHKPKMAPQDEPTACRQLLNIDLSPSQPAAPEPKKPGTTAPKASAGITITGVIEKGQMKQ
jgi:hypothetical protein